MLIEIHDKEWRELMSTLIDLAAVVEALRAELVAARAEVARLQSNSGLSADDQATLDATIEAAKAALAGAASGTPSPEVTATPAPSSASTEAIAVGELAASAAESLAGVTQDNSGV